MQTNQRNNLLKWKAGDKFGNPTKSVLLLFDVEVWHNTREDSTWGISSYGPPVQEVNLPPEPASDPKLTLTAHFVPQSSLL